MKISLRWIANYLNIDFSLLDINFIIKKFTETTAEIESFNKITIDKNNLFLGVCTQVKENKSYIIRLEEKDKTIESKSKIKVGDSVLLKRLKSDEYVCATGKDLGSDIDFILPAISSENTRFDNDIWWDDFILNIDNKSITNRSDLWGHLGIAREISAACNIPFKNNIKSPDNAKEITNLYVSNETDLCKSIAFLKCDIKNTHTSSLKFINALTRLDTRPINSIVDAGQYITLDTGHPIHIYDYDSIDDKKIFIKQASKSELFTSINNIQLNIEASDIIICDSNKVLTLAGQIGGADSCVTENTKTALIEAAALGGLAIRKTARRLNIRTESSIRSEKDLSPYMLKNIIYKTYDLLKNSGLTTGEYGILIDKEHNKIRKIEFEKNLIEKNIGINISDKDIIRCLNSIGFQCTIDKEQIEVVVPDWRTDKDISTYQDIIEEIARMYGYNLITPVLPTRTLQGYKKQDLEIKYNLSLELRTLNFNEVSTYPLFFEPFLTKIHINPINAVELMNPISGDRTKLVTSLIPNLIETAANEIQNEQEIRIFEFGKKFNKNSTDKYIETSILSFLLLNKNNPINFYDGKDIINNLLSYFSIKDDLIFTKTDNTENYPWYCKYKSAIISYKDTEIGTCGILNNYIETNILKTSIFVCELNTDILFNLKFDTKRYIPLAEFPATSRDLSLIVPANVEIYELETTLKKLDPSIRDAYLVDFIPTQQQTTTKNCTFRIIIQEKEKTMASKDANIIYNKIIDKLSTFNIVIR